jgi:hypothetical protein
MPQRSIEREDAGAPPSGSVVPSRAWVRIIIVSATISALTGGLGFAAGQALATKSPPPSQDRLVQFEKAGCRALQAFPKHGWVCTT